MLSTRMSELSSISYASSDVKFVVTTEKSTLGILRGSAPVK